MNITYLNLICSALGGTTTHKYEINALNEWCTLLGGIGGHKYNNKALNELVTLYGGSTTYPYDIEAYNAILVLLGETGGYKYLKDALNALSGTEVNNFLTADTTLRKADSAIKIDDSTIREQFIQLNSNQTELYTAYNNYI